MGLEQLIPDFPRHIGIMNKFQVNNTKEFKEAVKRYNGRKRVIYSLYNLATKEVDKIVFDLDANDTHQNALKMWNYFKENSYKRMINFSGRKGFHLYLFCSPFPEVSQKPLLNAAQRQIAKEINLSVGRAVNGAFDLDESLMGDISRCVGLPGTYHTGGKLYVRSLPEEVFLKGMDAIKEYCKKPSFKLHIYGSKLFDLRQVKAPPKSNNLPKEAPRDYTLKINDETLQKKCPPCVISMLTEKGCYLSRFYASLFLKEIGFSREQIDKKAKEYFSQFPRTDRFRNNYEQYRRQQNVLPQLFDREDEYFFPTCSKLIEEGFCTGKCKFYPIQRFLYRN